VDVRHFTVTVEADVGRWRALYRDLNIRQRRTRGDDGIGSPVVDGPVPIPPQVRVLRDRGWRQAPSSLA
jgi:hypothetical protein